MKGMVTAVRLLIALLLSAVIWDFLTFRIPNELIIIGMITGLINVFANNLISSGFDIQETFLVILSRIGYAAMMLAIMTTLWKAGAFGGGDVKLVVMTTLFTGYDGIYIFIYSLVCSLVIMGTGMLINRLRPGFLKIRKNKKGLHFIHFSLPYLLGVLIRLFQMAGDRIWIR